MTEYQRKPIPAKEEREAKKKQARTTIEKNIAENKKSDAAFRANYERLKAERLAREKLAAEKSGVGSS